MPTSRAPMLGRSKTVPKFNGRSVTPSGGKKRSKPNGSILAFFKKAPSTSTVDNFNLDLDESLFIEGNEFPEVQEVVKTPTPPMDSSSFESSPETKRIFEDEGVLRFNEEPGPVKRQRVEGPPIPSPSPTTQKAKPVVRTGPFFEDSDDDDDTMARFGERCLHDVAQPAVTPSFEPYEKPDSGEPFTKSKVVVSQPISIPLHESTNIEEETEFENIEDFIDEEFPEEGEEYLERKWMEEHGGMEPGLEDTGHDDVPETRLQDTEEEIAPVLRETLTPACPICSMKFDGLTDQVRQSWSFFKRF